MLLQVVYILASVTSTYKSHAHPSKPGIDEEEAMAMGNGRQERPGQVVTDGRKPKQLVGRSALHSGECLMTGPTRFTPRQEERTITDDLE